MKLLSKVKEFLNRDKLFFKDAFLNMIAFAIYIVSQQIVLLPVLAKLLNEESYANVIIFITVLNVFCNVLGGQIGVTRQLQKTHYEGNDKDENNDFSLLMIFASIAIIVCFPIILFILKYDWVSIIFLVITALISNFRLYIRYLFRINSTYKKTIFQNLFYLCGVGCGLLLFLAIKIAWLPLILGEVFALIYTLFVIPHHKVQAKKSKQFKNTVTRYSGLGSADALTNAVTLIDKLLVYPLLGAYSLAVYNAGTATSKVAALVMNPLNEVILVKLSKAKEKGAASLLRTVIKVSLVSVVVLFLVLVPVIYCLSYVLYRQYLQDICSIILLLSIGCAVGTTSSVMKSFILRFAKPKQLTTCYLINLVVLAVCGCFGAKILGLLGFAISMVLGRVELWISFVVVLVKYCKSGGKANG
jgi:O-antigen/teichoic acid export membrane protein